MHRGHNGAIVLLRTLNLTLYYSELKMTEQLSKHVFNFKRGKKEGIIALQGFFSVLRIASKKVETEGKSSLPDMPAL